MDSFVHDVVINKIHYRVYFYKMNAPNGVKYFVFAKPRQGDSCCFNMEQSGKKWRIINAPKVNDTMLRAEGELSELITLSLLL